MSDEIAKQKILVIVGPTASGKSALAITLAKQFNGEIISADSRQVYTGLDIGTAKITPEEMQGVPHHLIDIVSLETVYTAAAFAHDAKKAINDITTRGKLPIIAGGTFFYIDTLLGRSTTPRVAPNPELRRTLEAKETTELFALLEEKDPARASTIDPKNKRRMVRALEIVEVLGTVPEATQSPSPYDVLTLGLSVQKEELRQRLRERAEHWLQNDAFIEEVRALLASGTTKERLQEIGFEYQLGCALLHGELTHETFITQFVEKNWQYAKRQLTWLKRDHSIQWVTAADQRETELVVEQFLRTV